MDIRSQNAINNSSYNQGIALTNPFVKRYGLKMRAPLACDQVSFTAITNKIADRADGITRNLALKIFETEEPIQKRLATFIEDKFNDMVATIDAPNNVIEKILNRMKSPDSMVEKSGARQLRKKDEILKYMTDMHGAKLILRDASKDGTKELLVRFSELIKKGLIELNEIEVKRPIAAKGLPDEEIYDYASAKTLNKLIRLAKAKTGKVVNYDIDYTESNYAAIHMLVTVPKIASRPFEIQIIGSDVNVGKYVDDAVYKALDGKESGYPKIDKLMKFLNEKENKSLRERFLKYRAKVMLFQREKEPVPYSKKPSNVYFLPLSDSKLNFSYDYNEMYHMMKNHDKAKLKAKK